SIQNPTGTLSGSLDVKHSVLTGTVSCVDNTRARIDARFAAGALSGTIAGGPLAATLKTNPPVPGAPVPRVPGSIAGVYALAPSSPCLGTAITLTGSKPTYTLVSNGKPRGAV